MATRQRKDVGVRHAEMQVRHTCGDAFACRACAQAALETTEQRDRARYMQTQRDELLTALREATFGWACYAKRQIEHDEIARLHRVIAKAEGK
jgi:hypothetical protein